MAPSFPGMPMYGSANILERHCCERSPFVGCIRAAQRPTISQPAVRYGCILTRNRVPAPINTGIQSVRLVWVFRNRSRVPHPRAGLSATAYRHVASIPTALNPRDPRRQRRRGRPSHETEGCKSATSLPLPPERRRHPNPDSRRRSKGAGKGRRDPTHLPAFSAEMFATNLNHAPNPPRRL